MIYIEREREKKKEKVCESLKMPNARGFGITGVMGKSGGLSPIQENVREGLTERLVFSDLVRTSLSRTEDASLLRVLLSGKDGLASTSVREKALMEVEVREEWRVAREREILARANDFGLVSVENPENRRKLAEEVASFTELARSNELRKSRAFGGGGGVWAKTSRDTFDIFGGGGDGQKRNRQLTNRSPYGGLGAPSGEKSTLRRPKSAKPALYGSTKRRSGGSFNSKLSTSTRVFGNPNSNVRPASGLGRDGRNGKPVARERGRVRPSSAPVTKQKSKTESKILDITHSLLKGLESHKSEDGTVHAITALQNNVSEAQSQLSRLLAAAKKKIKGGTTTAPTTKASISETIKEREDASASSPSDRFRMHLTKLGYFGSTKADLAIAEHQRQRHSVLIIQRAVRSLLRRKAAEKKRLEELERQRHYKARKIQEWFRSILNQRLRDKETLENCKKGLAARVIQGQYRSYLSRSGKGAKCKVYNKSSVSTHGPYGIGDANFQHKRNELKSLWKQHKAFTSETLRVQSYLVFLCFSSGREVRKVNACIKDEERMFSTSWLKYERKIKRKALHKPLPRNWVPHNDAVTGKIYFINTRTSEAYTTHPNLRAIAPELAMHKERASIAKYARISVLHKYIDAIESRSSKLQSQVLMQMAASS